MAVLDLVSEEDYRATALYAAVLLHGMSCLAEGSIPSRPETVIDTASKFDQYLRTGTYESNQNRGRNHGSTQRA